MSLVLGLNPAWADGLREESLKDCILGLAPRCGYAPGAENR